MTNILSAISGKFTGPLILGTFFPVAIFVILAMIFAAPLFPADWSLLRPIATLETQWAVLTITFITIVLTGLLYNLNVPIIRFYEGYPWAGSWIGRWRTRRYEAGFAALDRRYKGTRTLVRALNEDDKRYALITAEWARVGWRLNLDYPGATSLILPTRLGNVMRSYEHYPDRQYGMDSVTLWPRLVAKIEKDYAAAIDDAKASFDFMLNSSVLSAILALTILVAGLVYPAPLASPRLWLPWLLTILGFWRLAYLFYVGSIQRATARGTLMKGAFDLYRGQLLEQLGYRRILPTRKAERVLWDDISGQMLYGDHPSGPQGDYAVIPPSLLPASARGEPTTVQLEVARGVSQPAADQPITVTVCVRNVDGGERTAQNVVVIDTVPEGYEYNWNSASLDDVATRVAGANPYCFEVGALRFEEEKCLTYRIILRKK